MAGYVLIIWATVLSMPMKHGSAPGSFPKLKLLVRKLLLKVTDFTNVVGIIKNIVIPAQLVLLSG